MELASFCNENPIETPLENSIQPIALFRNRVISIREKKVSVTCLSGKIWITWPNGHERTLQAGQSCSILSKGKICIFAYTDANIEIESRTMLKWPIRKN